MSAVSSVNRAASANPNPLFNISSYRDFSSLSPPPPPHPHCLSVYLSVCLNISPYWWFLLEDRERKYGAVMTLTPRIYFRPPHPHTLSCTQPHPSHPLHPSPPPPYRTCGSLDLISVRRGSTVVTPSWVRTKHSCPTYSQLNLTLYVCMYCIK